MKGIVVSLEEFQKVPVWLQDRFMLSFSGKDKIHLISVDNNDELIGEAVCSITGIKKVPFLQNDGNINFAYPIWKGDIL